MKRRRGAEALRSAALVLAGGRLAVAVPVTYLGVVSAAAVAATLTSRRRPPSAPSDRVVAVLVPAHDEATVIHETVTALTQLDFPVAQRRIEVIADHCTDDTASIARSAGAVVHERTLGPAGKGASLAEAVERLLVDGHDGRRIDAFAVVDADTVVDPAFLRVVDDALDAGASVVQGQYRVRDAGQSTATGLRAVALALRHHVRPLGRTWLGASSGLYGNGMVFAREVLDGRPWSNHLTEDIELQMELLLDGHRVAYAPTAVVEAEMPTTLAASRSQNERWERGRVELARRYVPRLVARARRTRGRTRLAAADAALDVVVPPLSVLALGTVAVSGASAAVALARRRRPAAACGLLPLGVVAHVVVGVVLGRLPWSVVRSLLHAPVLVVWKVRLWLRVLVRGRDVAWIRTEHVGGAS